MLSMSISTTRSICFFLTLVAIAALTYSAFWAIPKTVTLVLAGVLFILSSQFFIHDKRELDNGVTQLKSMTNEIAKGNLDARADLEKESEFGLIARNINRTLKRFVRIINEVDITSSELNELAISTSNFANRSRQSSDNLNAQSSQLASTIEEISVSMAEITSTVQRVDENTNKVSTLSNDSEQSLRSLSTKLETLSHSVARFDQSFEKVEDGASKINSFVSIIETIAEQTSLLALNAAIEAARAGDQGRGFAVVADEVRSLAAKTQGSTKDITLMTEDLRRYITESGKESDEALALSKDAINIANASIKDTTAVLDEIKGISKGISEVYNSTNEQTAAIDSASESIHSLSELCNDASEQADELDASTTKITRISEHLIENVNKIDD